MKARQMKSQEEGDGQTAARDRDWGEGRNVNVLTHAQRFPTGFFELLTYNGVGPEYGLRATQQFLL